MWAAKRSAAARRRTLTTAHTPSISAGRQRPTGDSLRSSRGRIRLRAKAHPITLAARRTPTRTNSGAPVAVMRKSAIASIPKSDSCDGGAIASLKGASTSVTRQHGGPPPHPATCQLQRFFQLGPRTGKLTGTLALFRHQDSDRCPIRVSFRETAGPVQAPVHRVPGRHRAERCHPSRPIRVDQRRFRGKPRI